jgi:hypothetical protein
MADRVGHKEGLRGQVAAPEQSRRKPRSTGPPAERLQAPAGLTGPLTLRAHNP